MCVFRLRFQPAESIRACSVYVLVLVRIHPAACLLSLANLVRVCSLSQKHRRLAAHRGGSFELTCRPRRKVLALASTPSAEGYSSTLSESHEPGPAPITVGARQGRGEGYSSFATTRRVCRRRRDAADWHSRDDRGRHAAPG